MKISEDNITKAISGNPLSTKQIAKVLGIPPEDGRRMWRLFGIIDSLKERKILETAYCINAPKNNEGRRTATFKHYLANEGLELENRGVLSAKREIIPGKIIKEYKEQFQSESEPFSAHWYRRR